MHMRKLGATGIEVAPLVLGGNVFGWTADRETSFSLLDAYLEAGFNAIDTADVYSSFVPGNRGGESETVIGEWMKDRGVRDQVVIITKGGLPMGEGLHGLGRDYLARACEASLKRLQTDRIDIYMSHRADSTVPIEETLECFQSLADAGKILSTGCSNYTAGELQEALAAAGDSRARYEVVQPHYNLVARGDYEGALEDICAANDLGVISYFSLAAGFLTGKYRRKADFEGAARSSSAGAYFSPRNVALLDRLEIVAERHGSTPAAVALAWLMARPSVAAPIASATNLLQLADILKSAHLALSDQDMEELEG